MVQSTVSVSAMISIHQRKKSSALLANWKPGLIPRTPRKISAKCVPLGNVPVECEFALYLVHDMHFAEYVVSRVRIPHYDVISKRVEAGWATPVINVVRRFLIEEIYRRFGLSISTVFCSIRR